MSHQSPDSGSPSSASPATTTATSSKPLTTEGDDVGGERGTWGNKLEFILACIGYMVGLGNVWRFPYLAYENGGGAFVIPYIIVMFVIGIPLQLLETTISQFSAMGPVEVWSNILPAFQGVGYATIITAAFFAIFYNLIIAWDIMYLFGCFYGEMPWNTCNNSWNTENCHVFGQEKTNDSHISQEEFFNRVILSKSDHMNQIGWPRLEAVAAMFVAWAIVLGALCKGVSTSGKVVYVTATFPYLLMGVLFIQGIFLEGALDGIQFYITPDIGEIMNVKIWREAVVQVFFSMGVGCGVMMTYGSYNKFHNSLVQDTMILALGDTLTSLFAGFIVFSMIGFLAHKLGEDVRKVVEKGSGPGLAFIILPFGMSQMSAPRLWSILFFLMIFFLGIDSEFAYVENITSFFFDLAAKRKSEKPNKPLITGIICLILFGVGLPLTTSGGIYLFRIMDYAVAGLPVIFIAALENYLLAHIYGAENLMTDLHYMTSWEPGHKMRTHFMVAIWTLAPITLAVMFVLDSYKMIEMSWVGRFDDFDLTLWGVLFMWILSPMICVPSGIAFYIYQHKKPNKSIWETFKRGCKPTKKYAVRAVKHGKHPKALRDFTSIDSFPLDEETDKSPEKTTLKTTVTAES